MGLQMDYDLDVAADKMAAILQRDVKVYSASDASGG
jgi:hypothetical protein